MGENVINNTRRKRRWKVIFGILVLLTVMVLVYALPYHHAVLPDDYGTDGLVTVTKMNSGWLFDGAGDDQAMIFYPGAKVDSMAYAPLMWELAEEGLDCYLVDMPFHRKLLIIYPYSIKAAKNPCGKRRCVS